MTSESPQLHYITRSMHSPIQTIKSRCSSHFHVCMNLSTSACRLLLPTSVKEWLALRSSVNSSVVPGCHLYNKSSRELSLLLNIPQSAVSGVITKWNRLGTTETRRKMTERGQRMLRHIVRRRRQLSAESIATHLQTSCGLQISSRTVRRELHGMGFHGNCIQAIHHQVQCKASDAVV